MQTLNSIYSASLPLKNQPHACFGIDNPAQIAACIDYVSHTENNFSAACIFQLYLMELEERQR